MNLPYEWVEDALVASLVQNWPEVISEKRVAFKNLAFEAQGLNMWLKFINTPVEEKAITLGDDGHNELRGFLQIGIYVPIGEGVVASRDALFKLRQIYKAPASVPAPPDCYMKLTSLGYSQGGQTSIADFTRGGTEKEWDADYLTVYWLAREPRS